MQEVVCADCGAINRLNAEACWRCLRAMDEQPTPDTAAVAIAVERRPP